MCQTLDPPLGACYAIVKTHKRFWRNTRAGASYISSIWIRATPCPLSVLQLSTPIFPPPHSLPWTTKWKPYEFSSPHRERSLHLSPRRPPAPARRRILVVMLPDPAVRTSHRCIPTSRSTVRPRCWLPRSLCPAWIVPSQRRALDRKRQLLDLLILRSRSPSADTLVLVYVWISSDIVEFLEISKMSTSFNNANNKRFCHRAFNYFPNWPLVFNFEFD